MDLDRYVLDLKRQLGQVAENGSEESRAVVDRLVAGLDAAARLVLLDALSAAAGEITQDLAPGSVDLRLRGREVELVVSLPNEGVEGRPATPAEVDDVSTSRTTLRLPDALKARVDEAAATDGVSVNAWLVRAVADALQPRPRRPSQRRPHGGDSFTGWAR